MKSIIITACVVGALSAFYITTAGAEQSQRSRASSPSVRSDNDGTPPRDRSGAMLSSPKPLPTIFFESEDVTSAIGSGPIVIRINSFGAPVADDLLKALAGQIHLYTGDQSSEIPIQATVRSASQGTYTSDGRRQIPRATVEIQPTKPLADTWYVLKVVSVPNGFALPLFGNRQTLPDGSVGARLSPGSHPRPAAFKVCPKEGGVVLVSVEWSEPVLHPTDVSSVATIREVSASSAVCVAAPDQGGKSARTTRFLCQNVPAVGGRVSVALDAGIKGVAGRSLDIPVNASTQKATVEVALDSMQAGGDGCKIFRPW